ncbi:MAG: hypothetical protein J6033_02210 [Lachnospiraceae bacterium]|nr:hypothetical protein [Lachnospiraceae bacterium]
MQPLYTALKVNNEIELCDIYTEESKTAIEKALLKNRISYFLKWPKKKFFSRRKCFCTLCINDNSKDIAEEIINKVCEENNFQVRFMMKKAENEYL